MYRTRFKYDLTNQNDHFQLQCLKAALARKRYGCFFQQRVGKTRVGVEFAGYAISKGVDRVLILCPPSALQGWINEINNIGDTGRMVTCQHWAMGAQAISTRYPLVLVCSYDLAVVNDVMVTKFKPQCIVFDEVHLLKNISTRHKLSRLLADKAEWVLGLTGTPFSNHEYLDAYGVFRIIDKSLFGTSKRAFIDKYADMLDEFRNPVSWRPSAEQEIMEKINNASMRVTRADVGIEIDSHESIMEYELDPDERHIYDNMRNGSMAIYAGVTCVARHTWTWKIRLAQITSGMLQGTETSPPGWARIGTSRVLALLHLLDSSALRGKQAIVSVRFTAGTEYIMEKLQRFGRPTFILFGGMSLKERKEVIELAKRTSASVLLVQERTVAMGMDLSYTDQFIFYTWTDDSILHSQLKDRIAGRFQDSDRLHYYYLIARKTIDREYYRSTKRHLSRAEQLANWERYRKDRDEE